MILKNQELKTRKAIMHVLDVKNSKQALLSQECLKITDGDKFDDFIKGQIKSSLLGLRKKSCKYLNHNTNLIKDKIEEIISDDKKFEENTGFLASYLFNKMRSKTSASVDALFALFEDEDGNRFIALLLLEYAENIFHEIKEVKPNQFVITLQDNIISFPAANAGLKKGAFFKKYIENDIYNLIIDKNSDVQYFIDDFLDAEIIMDDDQATKEIYNVLADLSRSDLPTYTEALATKYLDIIENQTSINVDSFLRENTDEYTYTVIKSELDIRGIVEDEIVINPDYVEAYLKRVIFKLSNGSTIRIPTAFRKSDNFKMIQNEDGTYNIGLDNVKIIEEDLKAR